MDKFIISGGKGVHLTVENVTAKTKDEWDMAYNGHIHFSDDTVVKTHKTIDGKWVFTIVRIGKHIGPQITADRDSNEFGEVLNLAAPAGTIAWVEVFDHLDPTPEELVENIAMMTDASVPINHLWAAFNALKGVTA